MLKRGATPNKARKLTMLICAFFVLPVVFATSFDNLWISVVIIGVAAAAHQAFSANLYTLPSDLFPRYAVGSVIGIGGTVGAVGGMIFSKYAGYVLDALGSYTPLFIVAGRGLFPGFAVDPPAQPAARAHGCLGRRSARLRCSPQHRRPRRTKMVCCSAHRSTAISGPSGRRAIRCRISAPT